MRFLIKFLTVIIYLVWVWPVIILGIISFIIEVSTTYDLTKSKAVEYFFKPVDWINKLNRKYVNSF